MNTNKLATLSILGQIEENRQFLGYYKKLKLPHIPKGNETFCFEVGQRVKSNPQFCRKNGAGVIIAREESNGFCGYLVKWDGEKFPLKIINGTWAKKTSDGWMNARFERQKDLTLSE